MGGRKSDKVRILVVDDDIRTTHIFARMLREDGHEVDVVNDGAAAIEQLNRPTIHDVLVTDILMPHADGIAVARHGRLRKPSLPIIVVTGYPERISLEFKALEPTPLVFVKPLDYAALALKLLGVVRRS
jgi:CheY-like chemotaxis protein